MKFLFFCWEQSFVFWVIVRKRKKRKFTSIEWKWKYSLYWYWKRKRGENCHLTWCYYLYRDLIISWTSTSFFCSSSMIFRWKSWLLLLLLLWRKWEHGRELFTYHFFLFWVEVLQIVIENKCSRKTALIVFDIVLLWLCLYNLEKR